MIDKTATNAGRFLRRYCYFPRARDAFSCVLRFHGVGAGERVLLPAYIGWSPREGSGVFDPITENGITPVFYRMDGRLFIDEADAAHRIRTSGARVILFIHYFGFVDPAFLRLAAAAKAAGLTVIEDAAHALFSDMVGGICGRTGDYTLYSLHKQLPFASGGMLCANGAAPMPEGARQCAFGDPFSYDFAAIAQKRIENYKALCALAAPLDDDIEPLRPVLPEGVVPQTFPVIVRRYDRFQLYRELNEAGYGAVALYHTMIEPLRAPGWAESGALASHILNLPVHQDCVLSDYRGLIDTMRTCFRPAATGRNGADSV